MSEPIIKSNNEINVFISSNGTDEDFLIIRDNLKKRIENTGMAKVYLFEKSSASTLDVEPYYTLNVDTSDICIFIINNAEEIPEGVMKEYKRVKAIEKKSLFIFFGKDRGGKPNLIKRELTGPSGVKYYNLEESSEEKLKDVEDKVYQSLIDDITYIYKLYSNEFLVVNSEDVSSSQISEKSYMINTNIDKQLLKNLSLTKSDVNKKIYSQGTIGDKDSGTNSLDGKCKEFLKVVFGEKRINDFNPFYLINELEEIQDSKLHDVVKTRWESIIYYWSGELKEALDKENEALDLAQSSNMPDWFIQDILIDIRNLERIYNHSVGEFRIENFAQKKINENTNPLFYPVIDRYDKNLSDGLLQQVKKSATQSPYTIRYGNNLSKFGDLMANSYFVAVYYGSLTHIKLLITKIKDLSFFLCREYSDWEFRVLFLKTNLYDGPPSEVKRSIDYFNNIFGKMNDKDAFEIYAFVSSQPVLFDRALSCSQAFKYLGYHFNDEDYNKVYNDILNIFEKYIIGDMFSNVTEVFFEAINNNLLRLDNNKLFSDILIPIFDSQKTYLYKYAFKVIKNINFKELSDNSLHYLVDLYNSIVNSNNLESADQQDFFTSLIIVRLSLKERMKGLDKKVEDKFPDFFNKTYKHEISESDGEKEFIDEQIVIIKNRLKTQGVNGVYSGYVNNPFKTTINIIQNRNLEIDQELYDSIMKPTLDIVLSEKQIYSDKVQAMQLLTFVQSKVDPTIDNSKYYELIINNKNKMVAGQESLGKSSRLVLMFNYELLVYSFNQDNVEKIISVISLEEEIETFEIIECINSLSNLVSGKPITNSIFEILIVNFLMMAASDRNEKVRFNSIKVLIQMLNIDNKKYVLSKIMSVMDFDTLEVKYLVIQNLDIIEQIDVSSYEDIIDKAKVDNNYAVRELINKKTLEELETHKT